MSILNEDKYAKSPLFNDPELLSSVDQAKYFAVIVPGNCTLDEAGSFLPTVCSKTNTKLCNISAISF